MTDARDAALLLASGGPLAGALDGYAERPGQLAMAQAVGETLRDGGVLLCEAGTGTGKSLAYLLPAAVARRRVVVSTATKALQAQLLSNDVPLAAAAVGRPLRAEVLKGRANYVCRLHAQDVEGRLVDERHGAALERLRPWLATTATGDRAELDHEPPAALWAELAVGPERCRGARCPLVSSCYCEQARERAEEADVVIVNHALYFADLGLRIASDGRIAVLPEHDAVVFDEAHALEDVAAEWLGARVSTADLSRLTRDAERACQLDRLVRPQRAFAELERHGARLFGALPTGAGRLRLRERELRELPGVAGVAAGLRLLAAALEGAGEEADLVARQAGRLAVSLDACLAADADEQVVWSERGEHAVSLRMAPIDVGPVLREALWDEVAAAVLTSATLALEGDFSFVRRRLGLREAVELAVGSPFDHARQALLFLPPDAPDPRDADARRRVADLLVSVVRASRGRALCLFTSHAALDEVHALAAPRLKPYRVLRQGAAPRERLLEDFRRDVGSVLFATASFWQGVDVPGESCSCVVIDRLPFAHPGDPLVEARAERIARDGRDPFAEYQVPTAVLALKQGFGRLLRRGSDRGVVAILDGRLRTAAYAGEFLAGLPPATRCERLDEVKRFLAPLC